MIWNEFEKEIVDSGILDDWFSKHNITDIWLNDLWMEAIDRTLDEFKLYLKTDDSFLDYEESQLMSVLKNGFK